MARPAVGLRCIMIQASTWRSDIRNRTKEEVDETKTENKDQVGVGALVLTDLYAPSNGSEGQLRRLGFLFPLN